MRVKDRKTVTTALAMNSEPTMLLGALPEIDSPADTDFRISPDDLSRRARHLDMILTHFWKRWRAE
ncbi:unnamed protein product, partial [Porites lobata]